MPFQTSTRNAQSHESIVLISYKSGEMNHNDKSDSNNICPITYAIKHGHSISSIKPLLEHQSDTWMEDEIGNNVFHDLAKHVGTVYNDLKVKYVQEVCNAISLRGNLRVRLALSLRNKEGYNPLHVACNEGYVNVDLIQWFVNAEADLRQKTEETSTEWQKDKTATTTRERTALHILAKNENERTQKILKVLLRKLSEYLIHMTFENNEETQIPLELASRSKLPRTCEILLGEWRHFVTPKQWFCSDKKANRGTALHYSAANGEYASGIECFYVLLESLRSSEVENFENTSIRTAIFGHNNEEGVTVFALACQFCPKDVVLDLLNLTPTLDLSLTRQNIRAVYTFCPPVVTTLLDTGFIPTRNRQTLTDTKIRDRKFDTVDVDYGILTGYKKPKERTYTETHFMTKCKNWSYCSQKEFFSHPVVKIFLMRKSRLLRNVIWMEAALQVIWLLAYTNVVLCCASPGTKPLDFTLPYVVLVMRLLSSALEELVDIYYYGLQYFKLGILSWWNLLQGVVDLVLVISFWFYVGTGAHPRTWFTYISSVGVLLAYTLTINNLANLYYKFALTKLIFQHVFCTILRIFACCLPLLVGFTIALAVVFEDSFPTEYTEFQPFIRVLIMMIGGIDFDDNLHRIANGTYDPLEGQSRMGGEVTKPSNMENIKAKKTFQELFFPYLDSILFLGFLIAIPIAFFHLLTGIALGKVQELNEKAAVNQMLQEVAALHDIELRVNSIPKLVLRLLRIENVYVVNPDNEGDLITVVAETLEPKWLTESRLSSDEVTLIHRLAKIKTRRSGGVERNRMRHSESKESFLKHISSKLGYGGTLSDADINMLKRLVDNIRSVDEDNQL